MKLFLSTFKFWFLFFLGFSTFYVSFATLPRKLHVIYATDPYSDYAKKGVTKSAESVKTAASCDIVVHHITTENHWSCEMPMMQRFDVHGPNNYLQGKACAAWLRVFVIEETIDIPLEEWAIYLDADTYAEGDLCDILNDLDNTHMAAAVKMNYYKLSNKDFFNATQLFAFGVHRLHRAGINNGVFAFHKGRWMERNITSKILEWQKRASEAGEYPLFYYNDMAAMSLVFLEEGYKKLDKRFNCMQENDNNCIIRHYVGSKKPWD